MNRLNENIPSQSQLDVCKSTQTYSNVQALKHNLTINHVRNFVNT